MDLSPPVGPQQLVGNHPMEQPRRSLLVGAGLVVSLAVAALVATLSPSFEKCMTAAGVQKPQASQIQSEIAGPLIFRLARCDGLFVDENSNALTAIATVIMAGFTFTVWLAITGQAASAKENLRLTRETLRVTERSFVYLDDFDVNAIFSAERDMVIRFIVTPRWKNSGRTPTKNMSINVNWLYHTTNLPETFVYPLPETGNFKMFIGPNASASSPAIEINRDDVTRSLRGNGYVYIWGRVDYEDVFTNTPPHYTQFSYRISVGISSGRLENQFIAYGGFNKSDQDKI